MKPLYLHPGKEKRVLRGHRWIFSNEIASPLNDFEPGSWVEVYSSKKTLLGSGYINPKSLIAVRMVCPPGNEPTRDYFQGLLAKADTHRRETLYPGADCYRAVFGESDGIPGLIVDRYGDVVCYQITTLGMARVEHEGAVRVPGTGPALTPSDFEDPVLWRQIERIGAPFARHD